jgi:hypothetical protein
MTRIDTFKALCHASNRYPQLRICQLIFNALDAKGLARWPSGEARDTFYITDEVLAQALREYRP